MKTILLGLILTISLNAGWVDGNNLVSSAKEWQRNFDGDRTNPDYTKIREFQLYVYGVVDSVDGILFCLPSTANGGQIFSIVTKYINQHPEQWSNSAWDLVYKPLQKAFPCKKKK